MIKKGVKYEKWGQKREKQMRKFECAVEFRTDPQFLYFEFNLLNVKTVLN